jgi:hypothetical protein
VIGDPDHDVVDDAAERAEREIGLPVQATIRSLAQWAAAGEGFIREVKSRPLVPVLVDDDPELRDELHRLERAGREHP